MYRDSVGNTYARLPAKKAGKGSKGASPGPKHGGNPNKGGPQKKHGINTDTNRSPWYVHFYAALGVRGFELGEGSKS